jgi:parallel beta-helix repeat protein
MDKYPLIREWLAVGIILLFFGTCIIPATAQYNKKPLPVLRGNWLYVGGSGPGNYTRIQDAVDNATDGDTVFVYDDSSPYVENIVIKNSINLIGEDRNTTIIDGFKNNYTISVVDNTHGVTISGFSLIRSEGQGYSAIYTCSNYNNIQNNNIFDFHGIRIRDGSIGNNISRNKLVVEGLGLYLENSNENTMYNNIIFSGDSAGIQLINSSRNTIIKNTITDGWFGIYIDGENNHITRNIIKNISNECLTISGNNNFIYENIMNRSECGIEFRINAKNNEIHENTIQSCDYGVTLSGAIHNNITRNNIIDCTVGLCYFYDSYKNNIYENNFIGNEHPGYWTVYLRETPFIFSRNIWDKNYWGKPLLLPKIIKGYIILDFQWYPYIIKICPGFRIDWHPAREPYDIPGTR